MKKSLVLSLALVILLAFGTLNTGFGLLTVSGPTQTFGFQNGSYIGFSDPITFATPADGGGTQLISGFNATFPNWMFFQVQGSSEIYGFYVTDCSLTVSNYFVDSYLQFTTSGAGIVKVYVGTLGVPTIVTGGVSGYFDNTLNVATLTITSAVSVRINFGSGGGGLGGGGGGGSNPTPTPHPTVTPTPNHGATNTPIPTNAPTPTPTLPPLGTNDFQVSNFDLGTVQTNSVVTANLHFRFSGSSYTLQAISLPEPFNSWYLPNGNFSSIVYMLNANGESSGDVNLRFAVGNVTSQSFSGSFSVTAMDAFASSHTSSGTIDAKVSTSSIFDFKVFFMGHPLYLVLIAVVVIVLLAALVMFSKRRR